MSAAKPAAALSTLCVASLVMVAVAAADSHGAAAHGDPLIAGAGDISCGDEGGDDECDARGTSDVLVRLDPDWVFTLGDNQYPDGRLRDYRRFYDPTWGRLKSRTHPALGNHEYGDDADRPQAYARHNHFAYFDDPALAGDPSKGYYSYDLPTSAGAWHVIVLNTGPCFDEARANVFCGARSAQRAWLRKDLAESHASCILAYWHQPRFSDGTTHGDDPVSRYFWSDLYEHGATVVINGHDHIYERFAPMNPNGRRDDERGIFEFVVGTGGGPREQCARSRRSTSEICRGGIFGVLALRLHPSSFTYEFVPADGAKFRDGPRTLPCRGTPGG